MHKCISKSSFLASKLVSPFKSQQLFRLNFINNLNFSNSILITMLFFLVSCLSFLLLSKSFLKPQPTSKVESRMWEFPWILYEAFHIVSVFMCSQRQNFTTNFQVPKSFPSIKRVLSARSQFVEEIIEEYEKEDISLLDLPDLALDCILEKLSPKELCITAGVCSSLREKCTSDHLWRKHMKKKWEGVIGDVALREWQCQNASRRAIKFLSNIAHRTRFHIFSCLSEKFWYKSEKIGELKTHLPVNSVMSFYLALESGRFWFPAQVFNRENGHVGFMLSCYDARLCYDSTTDNFIARYRAQGRSSIEEGIEWCRIRAPSVATPANVVHVSECLDELKAGDHIEIQWRRNRDLPFGWWYGVVGHLDSCNANEFNCHCHISDTVILEFKQYTMGLRWRKTSICRKDHREVGNEADGFYGGIRKLRKKEEISKWEQLWPNCTLE